MAFLLGKLPVRGAVLEALNIAVVHKTVDTFLFTDVKTEALIKLFSCQKPHTEKNKPPHLSSTI